MSLLSPDRYVSSVDRIDLSELWEQGIRLILLDRDNTLVPRDAREAPPAVTAWLDEARARGFSLAMVSNNWHFDEVERTAGELGLRAVGFCCKPLPFALSRERRRALVPARAVAMVGDQLFTDMWAGKLAGATTILVQPQCRTDLWYTQIFRIFERAALKRVELED